MVGSWLDLCWFIEVLKRTIQRMKYCSRNLISCCMVMREGSAAPPSMSTADINTLIKQAGGV
jgi:hypothetical protein